MEAQEISRLVEEARQGDIAAFQALYEHYVKRIYNFLLRLLGSVHEAEDLTQQTFVVAFQQVGTLRDAAQIESWIYRIARNEAYQRFRRKNPESIDDRKLATGARRLQEDRLHTQPEKNLLNVELSSVIQSALDSLPDKLREVFVLAVIQEMSYQEITEVVGRSLHSVKTDIYRARLQIKEELRKYTGARAASGAKGKIP
jgi:RNA polymerase sigma-70 factor (ECF subfamily)